jgi:hypothetical protein
MDALDATITFCERVFGRKTTVALRWLLFVPVALVFAAIVFICVMFAAGAADSQFEGSGMFGALLAGISAGISAVELGTGIAPSHRRLAAVILTAFAALLGYSLVQWARSTHDAVLTVHSIIGATLFGIAAVGATIYVFTRNET